MAKLIAFTPDKSRRRALKKAGRKSAAHPGQLNLFTPPRPSQAVQSILTFSNPFAKALYLDEQGHPAAEQAYREAIDNDIRVADSWCNLAIIYASRHEDLKAIDAMTQSLKADPRHAVAHYNLANLYLDQGNLALARLHYELALTFDQDLPEVYFNLGLVYLINGQRDKAVDMLQRYEALIPGGLDELSELLKDHQNG